MLKKRDFLKVTGDDDICLYSDDEAKKVVVAAAPPSSPDSDHDDKRRCVDGTPEQASFIIDGGGGVSDGGFIIADADSGSAPGGGCVVVDDSDTSSSSSSLDPEQKLKFLSAGRKQVCARTVLASRKHRLQLSPTLYGLGSVEEVAVEPAAKKNPVTDPGAFLSNVDLVDSSDGDADSAYEDDCSLDYKVYVEDDDEDDDSGAELPEDSSDSGADILVALRQKKRGAESVMCFKAILMHYVRAIVDTVYTASPEETARGKAHGGAFVKMHATPLKLARAIRDMYPQAEREFSLLKGVRFASSEWGKDEATAQCAVCNHTVRPIRYKVALGSKEDEHVLCCVWCVKTLQCFNTLVRFWPNCAHAILQQYKQTPAGRVGVSVFTLRRLMEQIEAGRVYEDLVDEQYRQFCGLKTLVADNADAVYKKALERKSKQQLKTSALSVPAQ
jgi:hypothetical protein